jgi:predicted PurR-regulated permease PerM
MSVQVPQVILLMPSNAPYDSNHGVPLRAIAAAIGMVLLTGLSLLFLYEVRRTLVWLVVALFFAVALYPVIGWVQRHLTRSHRLLATLLVFLVVLILIASLITLFAIPLAREGALFVQQLPHLIEEARAGRGVIGRLLNRTNALHYLQENQDRIRAFLTGLTAPAARVLQTVVTGVAGVITIFILALLMVLEGPKLVDGALNLVSDRQRRERTHQVAADCAKSITGYISGNLLISVICGGLIYAALKIMGVPGDLKDEPTTGEEEVPITTEPPPPSGPPGAGSHISHRRPKAARPLPTALSRPQRSRRRPGAPTPPTETQSAPQP